MRERVSQGIVICNCRIVPAMQMGLQVVLPDELPMEF